MNKWISVVASALLLSLSLTVVTTAVAQTVGYELPRVIEPEVDPEPTTADFTFLQANLAPASPISYAVPAKGKVTAFRVQTGAERAASRVYFHVLRRSRGLQFTVVNSMGPLEIEPNQVNAYPANLSVEAGDEVAMSLLGGSDVDLTTSATEQDTVYVRLDTPSPGQEIVFPHTFSNKAVAYNAEFEASAAPGSPGPDSGSNAAGSGQSAQTSDRTAPTVRITTPKMGKKVRIRSKRSKLTVKGTSDLDTQSVEVSIRKLVAKRSGRGPKSRKSKRCLYLKGSGKFGRAKACNRSSLGFVRATGTQNWKRAVRLAGKGTYEIYARATDSSGNRTADYSKGENLIKVKITKR